MDFVRPPFGGAHQRLHGLCWHGLRLHHGVDLFQGPGGRCSNGLPKGRLFLAALSEFSVRRTVLVHEKIKGPPIVVDSHNLLESHGWIAMGGNPYVFELV